MIKAIEELKREHSRMTTVLGELETLEDGVGADYTGRKFNLKIFLELVDDE